ncbi:MAG: Protein of unknown function transrane [Flavipsychrobacter sp.]|jgi:inner membrane protein|nr:Protein of unknown function transrane [Flavipsychrobacter sp.]
MDSVTHVVLGACIGEVIAGKQLGRKVLFLGAIAQSLPDIDFVAASWLSTSADLLAHRGITHSFLFIAIVAPILAWLCQKGFRKRGMTFGHWLFFWGLQIFIHQFIDAFNAYGTGWFEPFSHQRVSFNTMFVADPLFTIWPIAAFIVLLVIKRNNNKRRILAWGAIALSSIYLIAGVTFKSFAENRLNKEIRSKNLVSHRHFTTPTPLNNLLWYIVAESDSGYSIGYWSVFDKSDSIDFHFVYKNDTLLQLATHKNTVDDLIRFSQGYYAVQMWHDTLVFNDLRFGEVLGWSEKKPKFVFYYLLEHPFDNKLIVQRGRFARWDKANIKIFLRRIGGD